MLAVAAVIVWSVTLLLVIEAASERRDSKRYPPPGRISTQSHLHVLEQGSGGPAVILESGLAASSLCWVLTQSLIAKFTRVIAYDRAGLGWSSPDAKQLTLGKILSDLDSVTKDMGPLILVGHSFGGLIVSAFACSRPDRVAGILLLDPVSLATYAEPSRQNRDRLQRAVRLCRRGAFLAHLAIVRGALSLVGRGKSKLPSLIGRISAGNGSSVMNRLAVEVAKLPPETHGPIRAHWSRPASFRSLAKYLELLPDCARQARFMPIPAQIPVIVLSAASALPAELAERDSWTANHIASRHTQIPDTTHWLQLDRPDLVAAAVKQLTSRATGA